MEYYKHAYNTAKMQKLFTLDSIHDKLGRNADVKQAIEEGHICIVDSQCFDYYLLTCHGSS